MISSNLLYFLAAILVLSISTAPEEPQLAPLMALPLLALILLIFHRVAVKVFRAAGCRGGAAAYFAAESRLTLLAAVFFAGSVVAFDLKYYLRPLSWGGRLPTLENLGGLLLFFLFLTLLWLPARPVYERLFGRSRSPAGFAAVNIRLNLPVVLPWLILTLIFDLLRLPPAGKKLLDSSWGEPLFFLVAVLCFALFFPPLISRLWGCSPLPPGPTRSMAEAFFRQQKFSAAILSWPLLEGRALTAAVMGIAPKFRYLLLTPALTAALDQEELEAVLAHEIGHVKKGHLLLYLLLLLGFSLLADALAGPLIALLFGSGWFWRLLLWSGLTAEKLAGHIAAVCMLALTLLYFRFLFGWFIRNFERQADLHAFHVQGGAFPLIRAFEKIAVLTGSPRNQKNWHHFGLGERMDFLFRCEHEPWLARRHERKVRSCLAAYFLLIGAAVGLLPKPDGDAVQRTAQLRYAAAAVEQKLREEPGSGALLRLRAELLLEQGKEREAATAFAAALQAEPDAGALNNLAWLLLTAKDSGLRDPAKALPLAEDSVRLEERGHSLDTLAMALWAQGRTAAAVAAEKRAAVLDPANRAYYQAQAKKMAAGPWPDLTQPFLP
ncbi:M48 family metallopeptidase [Candidatus Electronema sp. JC]|uniref:M48 family metallopeptidase n=1 Tax=Candidatus Electronema sp. JC TaxID=3401570 RepID=UPI003B438071